MDRHTSTDRCGAGWVSLVPDPRANPWRHVAIIALAHGMLRMARRNALADRLDAVETLGARGVIRTYKTDTLTERRMTVSRVALDAADMGSESFAQKVGHEPPGNSRRLRRLLGSTETPAKPGRG